MEDGTNSQPDRKRSIPSASAFRGISLIGAGIVGGADRGASGRFLVLAAWLGSVEGLAAWLGWRGGAAASF
ncbi:unnamed protein product [Dovyalis caffra]|uniref:Uncharacterized protein n=1 Tax=Dovyalis caffra TaxID=77055 RepID=A0AAV1R668_9ROSI|nr:unnamed protein product [Dovyalis caffra]